ncbi:MAG: hypothetical protein GX899_05075 [Rikenellaceae bacterium]|jgi:endonuclease G|nr:hypothetical protein [Rikenellaceae bacterium]
MAHFKLQSKALAAILIVSAMAFSSCLKEAFPMEPVFSVRIEAQSLDTKTEFGAPESAFGKTNYPVLWKADKNAYFSLDGAAFVSSTPNPSADYKTASFEIGFATEPKAEGGIIYGFSPAGSLSPETGGFTAITKSEGFASLVVPVNQTPLAGSVDPASQAIFGSTTYPSGGVPDNLSMNFSHALAYGRMTLSNYGGGNDIAWISITFPVAVAGNSCKYYFEDNGDKLAGNVYNSSSKTIKLDPQNAVDKTFWFSVVPTGTIDSGEIVVTVAKANGDAYIKAISLSDSKSIAFNKGKISGFTVNMEGIAAVSKTSWELVNDASELSVGDELVIASNAKGKTAGALTSAYLVDVSSGFSADKSTISSLGEGTLIFKLGGSAGAWTLSSGSQKLGATAVKKLAFDNGTTTWSITISSNGDATIQNGTSSYGRFLHNVNYTRFTTYTSDPNISMLLPQLYKKDYPKDLASANVSTGTATGITQSSATLSASYSNATSEPTSLGFEYGTSENNLNSTVNSTEPISGLSGSYSASLTGLSPSVKYYYRAVVQLGAFRFYGSVMSFTTSEEVLSDGRLELPAINCSSSQLSQTLKVGDARNYTYLYDKDLYCPLWSAYPLYSSVMNGSYPRPSWMFNPNFSQNYQITVAGNSYPTAYNAAAYSRGHHVPNADRNNNEEMQRQTFYVTNQSPQLQNKFNGSIWSALENAVRNVAAATDTVYVVTGATFQKQGSSEPITYLTAASSSYSPSSLPIPNYFWKVLLKVKRSGGTITGASAVGVWFEHREYESGDNFTNYTVSVDQIETWTGFNFFVNLPSALESSAETNSSWNTFSSF